MVGRDRLPDLGPIPRDPYGEDEESHDTRGVGFMAEYFADVRRIKQKLAVIRENTKDLEALHKAALTAVAVDGKKSSDEMEDLMDDTSELAQEVRQDLKRLEQQNDPGLGQTCEGRIRTNMQGALGRSFMTTMTNYQTLQAQYKEKYKERMARQFKIAKPKASQEEIAEMLEHAEAGQSVFADNILSASHAAAKNALADIQEKHQDILRLEKSMEELHQLFVDMSTMVEQQGELLNQIEFSVGQSVTYTEEAMMELKDAAEYQRSAQKKKLFCFCCIFWILVVAVGIIVGVLKVQGAIFGGGGGDATTSTPGTTPTP